MHRNGRWWPFWINFMRRYPKITQCQTWYPCENNLVHYMRSTVHASDLGRNFAQIRRKKNNIGVSHQSVSPRCSYQIVSAHRWCNWYTNTRVWRREGKNKKKQKKKRTKTTRNSPCIMDNLKRNSIKQEKRDNELWLACIIEFQLSIRPVWRLTSHKYASACVCILLGIVRIQYGFKRYGRGRLQLLLHILQTEHGRPIPLDPINFQGSSKRTASQGVEILPKLILSPLKKNFMYESEYWRR